MGGGPQEMFRACADVEISSTARARVNSRRPAAADRRRGSSSGSGGSDTDTGKSFWGSRGKNVVHDHGTKHKPSTAENKAITVKKTPSSFRVSGKNGYSFFSMGPKSAESSGSSESSSPSPQPAQRRRGGYYNNDDSQSSSSSSEKGNKRRRNRNKKRKPLKKRRKNEHVHIKTESRRRCNGSTKSPPTPPQGGRFTYYEQTGDTSNSHAYFWVPASDPGSETRKTPASSASKTRRTQALHSDQRASVQLLPAEEDSDDEETEAATSLESYFRMFTAYTRESKLLAKYFLDSVSAYLS